MGCCMQRTHTFTVALFPVPTHYSLRYGVDLLRLLIPVPTRCAVTDTVVVDVLAYVGLILFPLFRLRYDPRCGAYVGGSRLLPIYPRTHVAVTPVARFYVADRLLAPHMPLLDVDLVLFVAVTFDCCY